MSTSPAAWPRSYLFVPGDRPERFDKAWASAADAVILDLEDAVAPTRKPLAREAIAGWLDPSRPVWLRLNAADGADFGDDLALIDRPGVAGVLLPKAEDLPAELARATRERGLGLVAIIETAVGMSRAEHLAATPGVQRLAFGALDFQVDCGIEGDDEALQAFRSRLVLASRLGGLPAPVDGVTPSIDDAEAVRRDTLRARQFGFGGKLCIHPAQIATVHREFSPSDAERAWAQRVIEAIERAQGAAVQVDGRMVDRPVWLRAQRIAAAPPHDRSLRGA